MYWLQNKNLFNACVEGHTKGLLCSVRDGAAVFFFSKSYLKYRIYMSCVFVHVNVLSKKIYISPQSLPKEIP